MAATAMREKRAPDPKGSFPCKSIPHGQTEVSPNAIELHPVLKLLAASCSHYFQARAGKQPVTESGELEAQLG
jgi:hypothetical protein